MNERMINMAKDLEESLYEIEMKAEQIRALEFIERDAIQETYRTTKRIAKNDDDELFLWEFFFGVKASMIYFNRFSSYWITAKRSTH